MFRGLSNDRRQMGWNSTSDCSRSRSLGLVRSQRRLCHNHLDMMPSVVRASRDTVDMCQDLFSDRRWNCSTILRAPNFLPDLAGSKFTSSYCTLCSVNNNFLSAAIDFCGVVFVAYVFVPPPRRRLQSGRFFCHSLK